MGTAAVRTKKDMTYQVPGMMDPAPAVEPFAFILSSLHVNKLTRAELARDPLCPEGKNSARPSA